MMLLLTRISVSFPIYAKLGVGDLHDGNYNDMSLTSTMEDLDNFADDSRYVGLPLDHEECRFTFRVYPSDEMKSGKKIGLFVSTKWGCC
jgi:hypothetical protein